MQRQKQRTLAKEHGERHRRERQTARKGEKDEEEREAEQRRHASPPGKGQHHRVGRLGKKGENNRKK